MERRTSHGESIAVGLECSNGVHGTIQFVLSLRPGMDDVMVDESIAERHVGQATITSKNRHFQTGIIRIESYTTMPK